MPKSSKNYLDIQLILNLSILFFSAVAFIQHYIGQKDVYTIFTDKLLSVTIAILILLALYAFWCFASKALKSHSVFLRIVNISLYLLICCFTIFMTGGNESNYKYLFILTIISSTIEGRLKVGLIVSGISSVYLLTLDTLLFNSNEVSQTVNLNFENDLLLSCVFFIITYTVGSYITVKQVHIHNLEYLAHVDEMTGLYNYRYFVTQMDLLCRKAEREGKIVSIILMDIDHLKNYNDLFGHDKGTELLHKTGELLRGEFPQGFLCFRYGGDEFAVILPEKNEQEALTLAEKFRLKFETYKFDGEEFMTNGKLTVSLGVACFPKHARDSSNLIKKADEALYRAKFLRRNRTEIYVSFIDELQQFTSELGKEDLFTTVKTLIAVINSKDKYTYMHTDRVFRYCKDFADYLNLPPEQKEQLVQSAFMHDIGKINIATNILLKPGKLEKEELLEVQAHPNILLKPGKLEKEELLEVQAHPVIGANILKSFPSLKPVCDIIIQHHEKYDGTGYPKGLAGENILYLARILCIIDSYDAMSSERPYKKAKTPEEARLELQLCAKSHFDPDLTNTFIKFLFKTE